MPKRITFPPEGKVFWAAKDKEHREWIPGEGRVGDVNYSGVTIFTKKPTIGKKGQWRVRRSGDHVWSFCATGFSRNLRIQLKRGECRKFRIMEESE